jgi:signal transduction histidine kinase
LAKGFDKRRLRWLLLLLFAALAVPTAILVAKAWSQLKWEAFHQYRGNAEELTNRIDVRLQELIDNTERRTFADYSFVLAPDRAASNVVQRSPLSNFPVEANPPGLMGYFQVDADGAFSTPLLPVSRQAASELGMGDAEYASRLRLSNQLRAVLSDNELVQSRLERDTAPGLEESLAEKEAAPAESREMKDKDGYSQQVFDELGKRGRAAPAAAPAFSDDAVAGAKAAESPLLNSIGKVSDLRLDAERQKKSEQLERESAAEDIPIRTFSSERDPYEFSILGSGHLVLFRNVWRDGQRYVQGLLIDGDEFINDAIGESFMNSGLAGMSSLIVAYEDDLIATFGGQRALAPSRYPSVAEELGGELLYRSRLAAPLGSLELIYSVRNLPPGPGATLLVWLSLVLALVFSGGFFILYRLGASQLRLAQQQQDFVSAVSHELKTPLTSIRMYGEMLKEGWAEESKRQGYYEFIHDEAERLSRLISNVLQLASITRNQPQLNLKPVQVGTLMDNVESKISSQVERAGYALRITRADAAETALVNIDSDCFLQILINLVDNAIKFSRQGAVKTIEIESKLLGDRQLMVSVRDHGPGIPKDQMQKIFQLFYRTESELTRETVGTGIGLAIVHQLTLAMGGSVDLVNAKPGAEFRLRFPVTEA